MRTRFTWNDFTTSKNAHFGNCNAKYFATAWRLARYYKENNLGAWQARLTQAMAMQETEYLKNLIQKIKLNRNFDKTLFNY